MFTIVAQARGYDTADMQRTIAELDLAKAAYEVDWREQHRAGYFNQLTGDSIERERLRSLSEM
ncbi:hypothetical protein [Marinobacter sp. BGYM27]|uniref:hypothetical protein n=1 Tax=Marinobacter sp. BGYM27 TaxID=2975597 RepID=UPI0021A34403|nr:hypothetical protein [Marinobacter sp. BGYM27]MDG5498659.1 hypothetical protein [Marinobacter sp. BGYM27]